MNKLKLVALQIDDMHLAFRDGLNYIVGKNNTGKTTIFNCIRYVLGLSKSIESSNVYSINLKARIDDYDLVFSRDVGDSSISVSVNDVLYRFRPMSKDLNDFFCEHLRPDYIFGAKYEDMFNLLDFFFLSEERLVNRRKQWEAINSVCGINVSLLSSLEKDITSLKKEVYKNKEIQDSVEEFLELLLKNLDGSSDNSSVNKSIEITKSEYFSKSLKDKELLVGATKKLEDIKSKSGYELRDRVSEIERVFISLRNFAGYERWALEDLESIVRGRNRYISYGEEIFSKFILILAIAKIAQDRRYNFPSIIVNDSYLSAGLDEKAYRNALEILEDVAGSEKGIQYIEFTYRDNIPKEYVVLNLNSKGALHVFRD